MTMVDDGKGLVHIRTPADETPKNGVPGESAYWLVWCGRRGGYAWDERAEIVPTCLACIGLSSKS